MKRTEKSRLLYISRVINNIYVDNERLMLHSIDLAISVNTILAW